MYADAVHWYISLQFDNKIQIKLHPLSIDRAVVIFVF